MRHKYLTILLIAACTSPVWSGLAKGAISEKAIRKLLEQPAYAKTDFSILCRELKTGRELFVHQPRQPLMPASNMKVVTTAAALALLGPEFTYETVFALHDGNLVIVAGGDPLTGDPRIAERDGRNIGYLFDQVCDTLAKRNIKHIPGRLVVDASLFDDVRFHPSWPTEQADKWWTAQISALNYNNNCLDITFTPAGKAGQPVGYEVVPATAYADLSNKCTSKTTGTNQIGALRKIDSNEITLIGKCRTEQTINVTIDRPSAYFAFVLAEHLLQKGITIGENLVILDQPLWTGTFGVSQLPNELDVIYRQQTPLRDVLWRCNRNSLNMAAESLFKTVGAYAPQRDGKPVVQGTWDNGREAIHTWLSGLGVSSEEFYVDDGSGLSRKNRMSARTLVTVLQETARQPYDEMFRNTLATPESGTLDKNNRFTEKKYEGRLFAKTGYIRSAWGLSGYCRNEAGDWLVFSVLANNGSHSPRSLIDEIVKEFMK